MNNIHHLNLLPFPRLPPWVPDGVLDTSAASGGLGLNALSKALSKEKKKRQTRTCAFDAENSPCWSRRGQVAVLAEIEPLEREERREKNGDIEEQDAGEPSGFVHIASRFPDLGFPYVYLEHCAGNTTLKMVTSRSSGGIMPGPRGRRDACGWNIDIHIY